MVTLIEDEKKKSIPVSKEASKGCLPMDHQSFEALDDMVNLKLLNDASILQNLRIRYQTNDIYCTIGNVLVSVNPFKMLEIYTPEVMDSYSKGQAAAPHIFKLSSFAYRQLMENQKPQSCIVAGERYALCFATAAITSN